MDDVVVAVGLTPDSIPAGAELSVVQVGVELLLGSQHVGRWPVGGQIEGKQPVVELLSRHQPSSDVDRWGRI